MTYKTLNSEPSDWHYLTQGEKNAVLECVVDAGEYIESIGKTDLATYTKEEFETLLLVVCNAMNKRVIPF